MRDHTYRSVEARERLEYSLFGDLGNLAWSSPVTENHWLFPGGSPNEPVYSACLHSAPWGGSLWGPFYPPRLPWLKPVALISLVLKLSILKSMKAGQQAEAIEESFLLLDELKTSGFGYTDTRDSWRTTPSWFIKTNEQTNKKQKNCKLLLTQTACIVGLLCERTPTLLAKDPGLRRLKLQSPPVLFFGAYSRKLPNSFSWSLDRLHGSEVLGRKAISFTVG